VLTKVGGDAWLSWDPPVEPGASTITYELVRSSDPANLAGKAACLTLPDPSTPSAVDGDIPASRLLFAYAPRATNNCPVVGEGPLGANSMDEERPGRSCP
jgi:hypothetical protein